MQDVKPAVQNLYDTKTKVSRALGKKESDATLQIVVEVAGEAF